MAQQTSFYIKDINNVAVMEKEVIRPTMGEEALSFLTPTIANTSEAVGSIEGGSFRFSINQKVLDEDRVAGGAGETKSNAAVVREEILLITKRKKTQSTLIYPNDEKRYSGNSLRSQLGTAHINKPIIAIDTHNLNVLVNGAGSVINRGALGNDLAAAEALWDDITSSHATLLSLKGLVEAQKEFSEFKENNLITLIRHDAAQLLGKLTTKLGAGSSEQFGQFVNGTTSSFKIGGVQLIRTNRLPSNAQFASFIVGINGALVAKAEIQPFIKPGNSEEGNAVRIYSWYDYDAMVLHNDLIIVGLDDVPLP